jgi:hypothetical protein
MANSFGDTVSDLDYARQQWKSWQAEAERLAVINSGLVRDYNYALVEAVRQDQEIERLQQAIEQTWRPEVEALRRQMGKWQLDFENESRENERLRTIEQAAHAWATAVENSEDDDEESEEYVDASHALYLALGRAKSR